MRLTLLTDYALRLLMYVGERPQRLCTIAEIATAHAISEAHLTKVTHQLARAGWLETVRGKGGGMRLARPAAAINLAAVVSSMEPDMVLVECMGSRSHCGLSGHCRLTQILQEGLLAFMQHLKAYSLADLLSGSEPDVSGDVQKRIAVALAQKEKRK